MYILSGIPVPTFRTPTGLTPWWRPVAVGWPTTGSAATYIGPRSNVPHVGASSTVRAARYFTPRGTKAVRVNPIPSMSYAFGPGVKLTPRIIKIPPVQGDIVVTSTGPLRLPPGAWLPTWSPAFTPGGGL